MYFAMPDAAAISMPVVVMPSLGYGTGFEAMGLRPLEPPLWNSGRGSPRGPPLGLSSASLLASLGLYSSPASLVQLREIPFGHAGTRATTQLMAEKAQECSKHPGLVMLAHDIVRDLPNWDERAEAEAIYDWVIQNVRYTKDPIGLEWVSGPCHTALVDGQEDCESHGALVGALGLAIGHSLKFRTISRSHENPEDNFFHVYPFIGITEQGQRVWLAADTTDPEGAFDYRPEESRGLPAKDWIVVP